MPVWTGVYSTTGAGQIRSIQSDSLVVQDDNVVVSEVKRFIVWFDIDQYRVHSKYVIREKLGFAELAVQTNSFDNNCRLVVVAPVVVGLGVAPSNSIT